MDILIMGNSAMGVCELASKLKNNHQIVVVSDGFSTWKKQENITFFSISSQSEKFPQFIRSFHFEMVIFMASRSEHLANQRLGGYDEWSALLDICCLQGKPSLIFVSSSEVYGGHRRAFDVSEDSEAFPNGFQSSMLKSMEDLAQFYRDQCGLSILTVHLPYLYGNMKDDSLITRCIKGAQEKSNVILPGYSTTSCDFVRDTDLAQLIWQIIDEGIPPQGHVLNVGSGRSYCMGDLELLLKKQYEGLEVFYDGDESNVPIPVENDTAKKQYNWIALYHLEEEFTAICEQLKNAKVVQNTPCQRIKAKLYSNSDVVRLVEFTAGAALMEILSRILGNQTAYRGIDVRLLFVVIVGSLSGIQMGIASVILACISLTFSAVVKGQDWRVLAYNPENWIPFVIYLVAGMITGYHRDSVEGQKRINDEQITLLEQNYLFLSDLYAQVLQNRDQYRDQILQYRDSFGRIFRITQKLDNLMPDYILMEAINILEDVLANQSIAIYTVSRHRDYARLTIHSKELQEKQLPRSLVLSRFNVMMGTLAPGKVWFNRDLIEEYPMYCMPLYNENRLFMLITLREVRAEQLTAYYMNLMAVLGGLIQSSLVRAAEYNDAIEAAKYVTDTRLLKREHFLPVVQAKQKIEDSRMAEFGVLAVSRGDMDLQRLSHSVELSIRDTDIVGLTGDTQTAVILLSQTRHEDVQGITYRLSKQGLHCWSIDINEAAELMGEKGEVL